MTTMVWINVLLAVPFIALWAGIRCGSCSGARTPGRSRPWPRPPSGRCPRPACTPPTAELPNAGTVRGLCGHEPLSPRFHLQPLA